MPTYIRNKQTDRAIARLARRQTPALSKESLATEVMDQVVEMCKGNPQAWRSIGNAAPVSITDAQQNTGQSSTVRENSPSPASKDATAPRGAQVSATAPTVEAGEAKSAA